MLIYNRKHLNVRIYSCLVYAMNCCTKLSHLHTKLGEEISDDARYIYHVLFVSCKVSRFVINSM